MSRTSFAFSLFFTATAAACSAPSSSSFDAETSAIATSAQRDLTEADAGDLVDVRAGAPIAITLDTQRDGFGWFVQSADGALGRVSIERVPTADPANEKTILTWRPTTDAAGYHQIVLEYRLGGERPAVKTLSFFVRIG